MSQNSARRSGDHGMTLIEVLAALVILSLLVMMISVVSLQYSQRLKAAMKIQALVYANMVMEQEIVHNASNLNSALAPSLSQPLVNWPLIALNPGAPIFGMQFEAFVRGQLVANGTGKQSALYTVTVEWFRGSTPEGSVTITDTPA